MFLSPRKLLITGSVSILSLGLVWGAWAFNDKGGKTSYKASDDIVFLKASSSEKEAGSKDLKSWERELIERQSTELENINYTDSIAKELVEKYFRAKGTNSPIDEEALAQEIIGQAVPGQYEISYREYKISDLKINSQNEKESYKKYGNSLGEASIKNVYDQSFGSESEILLRAIQLNREKEFAKLDPIIKNYENLIGDLVKIEVPTELASIHLNIVNSLSKIASSVKQFNIFLTDPFKGIFIVTSYANYGADLQDYMRELNKKMKDNGVTFSEEEPGSSIEKAANISLNQLQ